MKVYAVQLEQEQEQAPQPTTRFRAIIQVNLR